LEFEFYLADRLKMTVGGMRKGMSESEFQHWSIYHQRKAQRQDLAEKMSKHQKGR